MGDNKKEHGTIGLMILTVIIIFCVIAIIIVGFRMIKKNEDAKLAAASDTEYTQSEQNREELSKQSEHYKEEAEEEQSTEDALQSKTDAKKQESDDTEEVSQTDGDEESNVAVSSDTESAFDAENSEDEKVYLIKGNEKSSNRYEKADHLSYTTTIKYTAQDLSLLDSYGLKITRNEIYARHGRMFNDQELQEYFQRQKWYVPQTASNDFDTSCLNEVEKYNVELIRTYEQQVGGG